MAIHRTRARMVILCVLISVITSVFGREPDPVSRWKIALDGGITWEVSPGDTHQDFIEMSGEQIGLVIRYGLDKNGIFSVSPTAVWPMLRFHPNRTESHLRVSFGEDAKSSPSLRTDFDVDSSFGLGIAPAVLIQVKDDWRPLSQRTLRRVYHKGISRFEGSWGAQLSFRRAIFPSMDKPAAIDMTVLTNTSQSQIRLAVEQFQRVLNTSAERGIYGAYTVTERVIGGGLRTLQPRESTTFTVIFEAHKDTEPLLALDTAAEERTRMSRMDEILGKLQLQTPDPVLDTAFAFAKMHATENIFRTKGGLMHSPGGGKRYYAAIWTNDQAEYVPPFFGLLGDALAVEATVNAFRHFARFMNPEYRPIPTSIIAEGDNIWDGAGDRGDMAMIAYGAARFALAYGDRKTAEQLWPLVEWSLEYLRRKVTEQGVVASDSDELEGRFPTGNANLNTSSLYYDALRSAVMLGSELEKNKTQLEDYSARATAVRVAIELYFGANVEGFETYRYYDKADLVSHPNPKVAAYASRPDVLRAWIAMPLTMDIFDRKAGTIDALFSSRLWTADGLATEAGQITIWDRSTLYALRGVLAAGDLRRGMEHLTYYSNRRLLGDHVPYPFEAYPEGDKSQLAAESALYCRVYTEGLFGLRPTGLRSFAVTPRLPDGWPSMALRKVHAFGNVFDLEVRRAGKGRMTVQILREGQPKKSYPLEAGSTASVNLR